MTKIRFTRRILEDLEEAAKQIGYAKSILDKAVLRELKTPRNGDRGKHVRKTR